ncbi:hypothetical protein LJC58_02180 [Lachnospiraceae bacterium OttesenSCG-928-D06]|nr:hypothetical protein [Lachnospiraceae bacterium OttesenSCG-928-D06]
MDKARIDEIEQEKIGIRAVNEDIVCKGCIFSTGSTPFDNTPYKSYCTVYSRDNGKIKPKSVYFEGAPCKYRREK